MQNKFFSKRVRGLLAGLAVFSLVFSNLLGVGFAATAPSYKAPTLLTPANGSTLSGNSVTLYWSDEGAATYDVAVGNAQASPVPYGWFGGLTTKNVTVKNLPIDGSKIWIRIFANFSNGSSYAKDFSVTAAKPAATGGGGVTVVPTYKAPTLISPAPGSVLMADNVVLTWSNEGAISYTVNVGNKKGSYKYGSYKGLTATSMVAKNLPVDGSTVYVQIKSQFKKTAPSSYFTLTAFKKPVIQIGGGGTGSGSGSGAGAGSGAETVVGGGGTGTGTGAGTGTGIAASSSLTAVWANNGEDKITQDERRATSGVSVVNSVWDGSKISVFGAKNEVVEFNLDLEAGDVGAKGVSVNFNKLMDASGNMISSVPPLGGTTAGTDLFNWVNRDIELFYVRYLQIKGLSKLSYETYDERHVPKRMERPFTGAGFATGVWANRPDHDKFYPDIAVPLELKPTFDIAAKQNQSIWTDIYIPKTAVAGVYSGSVEIRENGVVTRTVPVELTVKGFSLPDAASSKTMVMMSTSDVNDRFIGVTWPNDGTVQANQAKAVRDAFFKLAHRHKISLINDDQVAGDQPSAEALARLNGSLFTAANGYRGPGENTPNDVYAIGPYGSWNWQSQGESGMDIHTNAWAQWFAVNAPGVEKFLYLIDESSNFPQTEQWAAWMKNNTGIGKNILSMATIPLVDAIANTPSLKIAASWFTVGDTAKWQQAVDSAKAAGKKFFLYNGKRPANGSFATEDDGVALRELAWAQYKKGVDRWFFWQSTYYNNYQGGMGQTNVFQKAQTFGSLSGTDAVVGETGWNYSNGDGVLFYPGTDKLFPADSYGVAGPLASLRLKFWRRGIEDVDYIVLAAAVDPVATRAIVNQMVPKAFWEYGVTDAGDPTWVRSDISWSINPGDWEAARVALANIIERK